MEQGFSSDGYIIWQEHFSAYPYRALTSDLNGCGWIAAYNMRRALGQEAEFDAVRSELDAMFRLRLPGPTTMRALGRYLDRYVPGWRLSRGRRRTLAAAKDSRAGILRYWEGREPHFVAWIGLGDGCCRFFNVAEDWQDRSAPMEEFLARTSCHGPFRSLTAPLP